MTNIPELERKWRAAAETQAEAKREFDATVRQMQGTGIQVGNEPAMRIAASNLAKAVVAWRAALDELLTAVEDLSSDESSVESFDD
jgi:hypothetical protein